MKENIKNYFLFLEHCSFCRYRNSNENLSCVKCSDHLNNNNNRCINNYQGDIRQWAHQNIICNQIIQKKNIFNAQTQIKGKFMSRKKDCPPMYFIVLYDSSYIFIMLLYVTDSD